MNTDMPNCALLGICRIHENRKSERKWWLLNVLLIGLEALWSSTNPSSFFGEAAKLSCL
jgi:hypothetical protein